MVERQIVARGIRDPRVLNALRTVPRHRFVAPKLQPFAYSDQPLPIGQGQTISQPYIVAIMTEQLALTGKERVLEIGTGSGYQAAVLAELCAEVYSIEIIPSLAEEAQARLREIGYDNVRVKAGDGFQGWPEQAPFAGILVTCATPEVPEPLTQQLAEGGRMVIPVDNKLGYQTLKVLKMQERKLISEDLISVSFVPMTGKYTGR